MPVSEERQQQITKSLKRCSEATLAAALRFEESRDLDELPAIVLGVLERDAANPKPEGIAAATDESRLIEDIGMDSFGMIEVVMTAEEVQRAIRPKDPYSIQSALICIENTHNAGGGRVYPLSNIQAIRAVATAHGIPMHLDGARLFNAVVASGVSAADYAHYFETVTFCLSKGLGAPAGSRTGTVIE